MTYTCKSLQAAIFLLWCTLIFVNWINHGSAAARIMYFMAAMTTGYTITKGGCK